MKLDIYFYWVQGCYWGKMFLFSLLVQEIGSDFLLLFIYMMNKNIIRLLEYYFYLLFISLFFFGFGKVIVRL